MPVFIRDEYRYGLFILSHWRFGENHAPFIMEMDNELLFMYEDDGSGACSYANVDKTVMLIVPKLDLMFWSHQFIELLLVPPAVWDSEKIEKLRERFPEYELTTREEDRMNGYRQLMVRRAQNL